MNEPFIGQICLFPYHYIPVNWVECKGQTMPIAQYQALYSLLGNQYGGDSKTTFGIPNLAPVKPTNGAELRYYIAIQGLYPPRD